MDRPIRLEYVEPSSLSDNPRNWRRATPEQTAALSGALAEVGWAGALLFNEATGRLIDGHKRKREAISRGEAEVPVLVGSWDAATEAKILATLDPLGAMAGTDGVAFDQLLREFNTGCTELQQLLAMTAESAGLYQDTPETEGDGQGEEPEPSPSEDLPDGKWPGDPEWGVPYLDLALQAEELVYPVVKWGTVSHKRQGIGTYHLYTDDSKFASVWSDPSRMVGSGVKVATEPNFSTPPDCPRAKVLWDVWRKRWVARTWQYFGIKILADLNVDPAFRELNFLGIPQGWRAYAVRSHRGIPLEVIEEDHAAAVQRAGTEDLLFVVFGGGKKVKEHCKDRGWKWVVEDADRARGRFTNG